MGINQYPPQGSSLQAVTLTGDQTISDQKRFVGNVQIQPNSPSDIPLHVAGTNNQTAEIVRITTAGNDKGLVITSDGKTYTMTSLESWAGVAGGTSANFTDQTNGSVSISHPGPGVNVIGTSGIGDLVFSTADVERVRIDGDTTAVGIGGPPRSSLLAVGKTSSNDSSIDIVSNNNTSSRLNLLADLSGTYGYRIQYDGNGNYFRISLMNDTVQTDRLIIDGNGLITGSGTSLGAWTTYTPSLTASTTNPTLGSGSVVSGAYCQIGKTVHFRANIFFGTSGVNPGSGYYSISRPPVTPLAGQNVVGPAGLYDASAAPRMSGVVTFSGSGFEIWVNGSVAVAHNAPWTWAESDSIRICGTYEAA